MKATTLVWYRLRWPREVDPDQAAQLFRVLATTAGTPVIIEAVGSRGSVDHRLALPQGRSGSVVQQLRGAVTGLGIEKLGDRKGLDTARAVELRTSTRARPLRADDLVNTSRVLLTSLAHVGRDEHLVLQWVLGRRLAPAAVPNRLPEAGSRSWLMALLAPSPAKDRLTDPELRNAVRAKRSEPGWRVAGRLGVEAEGPSRQRQLIRQVLGALRNTEAPGVDLRVRSANPRQLNAATIPWRLLLRLNINEMAALSTLPVGLTADLPVVRVGSRLLAP